MIRIGVTGSSGMIGRNFLEELAAADEGRREYVPVALVRAESPTVAASPVERRVIDFTAAESFRGQVEDLDVVLHLAGLTKSVSRGEFMRANVEATAVLLRGLERHGRNLRHFLFSSSAAACGPSASPAEPREESAPCRPLSRYGRSKLLAEELIRGSRLSWTILRLPLVLGRYDVEGLHLLRMARNGWAGTFGLGESYYSCICAQDIARVLRRMFLRPELYGQTINVCYDEPLATLELLGSIRAALDLPPRLRLWHLPPWLGLAAGAVAGMLQRLQGRAGYFNLDKARELTARHWVLSNARLRQLLGLERFGEEGRLAETVRWYREQGQL